MNRNPAIAKSGDRFKIDATGIIDSIAEQNDSPDRQIRFGGGVSAGGSVSKTSVRRSNLKWRWNCYHLDAAVDILQLIRNCLRKRHRFSACMSFLPIWMVRIIRQHGDDALLKFSATVYRRLPQDSGRRRQGLQQRDRLTAMHAGTATGKRSNVIPIPVAAPDQSANQAFSQTGRKQFTLEKIEADVEDQNIIRTPTGSA